jgi:WhiB family redox-sensing transcriptional regulator
VTGGPVKVCAVCGAEFTRRKYNNRMEQMPRFLARRFCSKQCATAGQAPGLDTLGRRVVPSMVPRPVEPLGDWARDGLCAEVDLDLWFPGDGSDGLPAKRICRRCPVRDACLEYAMRNTELDGIWGGLSKKQRQKQRTKQRQEGNVA